MRRYEKRVRKCVLTVSAGLLPDPPPPPCNGPPPLPPPNFLPKHPLNLLHPPWRRGSDETHGGSGLVCLRFDAMLSCVKLLALASERNGSHKEEGSEALGEAEGGEFWFPEMWISGSSCGVWVGGWRVLLVSLVAVPCRSLLPPAIVPFSFPPKTSCPNHPHTPWNPPNTNLGAPFGIYPGTLRTQPRHGGL